MGSEVHHIPRAELMCVLRMIELEKPMTDSRFLGSVVHLPLGRSSGRSLCTVHHTSQRYASKRPVRCSLENVEKPGYRTHGANCVFGFGYSGPCPRATTRAIRLKAKGSFGIQSRPLTSVQTPNGTGLLMSKSRFFPCQISQ